MSRRAMLCASLVLLATSRVAAHVDGTDARQPTWVPAVLHPISGRPQSPPALPGVQPAGTDEQPARGIYGGAGEAAHLGGFTAVDREGLSPTLWRYMLRNLTVKTVVDVGCGKGVSTSWFRAHGALTLCVEGSAEAVRDSLLPREVVVEHDFSRGPWWPKHTYDAAWSVEFSEHVDRRYMPNYLPIFESAALVFVTHSNWGGWHHVEVHPDDWWIARYSAVGLVYSEALTKKARATALAGKHEVAANGVVYNAQHLTHTLMVFLNPAVLRLPQHTHLFGGPGCFKRQGNIDCGSHVHRGGITAQDQLPRRFLPLAKSFLSDEEVGWSPPQPAAPTGERKKEKKEVGRK